MSQAQLYPPPFVYPYALLFWAAFLVVFLPEFLIVRRAGRQPAAQDRGSLRLIMIGNALGMSTAFVAPFLFPRASIVAGRMPAFWVGMALIVAGSAIRRHCFRMLGASFKGAVEVNDGQAVVERGAYRFVRHPSYAGALLLFVGVGFALTNWISVLALAIMVALVYGYRIHVEEAALVATLGDSYRAYMARTKRVIPFIW